MCTCVLCDIVTTHFIPFVHGVPVCVLTANLRRDFAHNTVIENGIPSDSHKNVFGDVHPLLETTVTKTAASILSVPA